MKQTTEIPQAIAREMLDACKALDAELQHGQNVPSVGILEIIRVIIAKAEGNRFLPDAKMISRRKAVVATPVPHFKMRLLTSDETNIALSKLTLARTNRSV